MYQGDKSKAYDEYSLYGGMPELIKRKTHEEKSTYLNYLINNVYLKDIVERNNLKNDTKVLGELLDMLSYSIGSLTNPPKLEKEYNSLAHIDINRITISNYLDAFVDSFYLKLILAFRNPISSK